MVNLKNSSKMGQIDQVSRYGAYGVLIKDSKILLTQKKSGPYKGLWGLPGGSMKFGESPEDALRRELLEECSLKVQKIEFLDTATSRGIYDNQGAAYEFYQVGVIYTVLNWEEETGLVPEEKNFWMTLKSVRKEELTPFANQIVSSLPVGKGWRPQNRIRGKVIGIAKNKDRLLVGEVLDDDGILKGWCPFGGGIEFGETAEDALKREVQEELECGVQITGSSIVWENIYDHHGSLGHEIIFSFPVRLDNPEIYETNRFQIHEAGGVTHWLEWVEIGRFRTGESVLFPPGLLEKIDSI